MIDLVILKLTNTINKMETEDFLEYNIKLIPSACWEITKEEFEAWENGLSLDEKREEYFKDEPNITGFVVEIKFNGYLTDFNYIETFFKYYDADVRKNRVELVEIFLKECLEAYRILEE